ncbi:MAG: hypothetical protein ACRCS0_09135 [Albidovulum sp.]
MLPGLTVWQAWYAIVTLAVALVALVRRDDALKWAATIFAANFVASNMIWAASFAPLPTQAAKNITIAVALFAVAAVYRRAPIAIAGGLHIVIVMLAAATDLALIQWGKRPASFLAWSYPDIAAGIGHAGMVLSTWRAGAWQGRFMGLDPRSWVHSIGGGFRSVAAARKEAK